MSPTHPNHEPLPHRVLLAGERVPQQLIAASWAEPALQTLLRDAKVKFGHALCECRSGRDLKLQLRTREDKIHLAVWPEGGAHHDVRCLFFRDELAHAINAGAAPAAPALKPDVAPGQGTARIALTLDTGRRGEQGIAAVSPRQLLAKLWDAGLLCRWHPTWSRDWGRVRWQLLEAAKHFTLDGQLAEEVVVIPRPFRPEISAVVEREWDAVVRSLRTTSRLHIAIGTVRQLAIGVDAKPPRVFLRHLRQPIGLLPACHEFLSRWCKSAVSNSQVGQPQATAGARPELVALFVLESNSRGGLWARAGWLMCVHPRIFVPAANAQTVQLLQALLTGGHSFDHVISDVPPSQRTTADWLLRHVRDPQGHPVARAALEVLDRGIDPSFIAGRADLAARLAEAGIPTWSWVPQGTRGSQQIPPLPPRDSAQEREAQQVLRDIANSPSIEYRYGPMQRLFNRERSLP